MKQKICMVGIGSGLALGTLGFTHCCVEDIGVLRSIPNLNIISPADSLETVKALEAAVKSEKSTYLRLTGSSNNPIIYDKDYNFKIGKSVTLLDGIDIVIFCAGAITNNCLIAANILKKKNISTKVVNMHTIKPIDKKILDEVQKFKLIVSVEEHNIFGGLGSAIAEYNSTLKNSPKQLFLGVKDDYSKGGTYNFLKEKHRLEPEKIVEDILKNFN